VVPPHQRFEAGYFTGSERYYRLVNDFEFIVLDGPSEIVFELKLCHDVGVHSRIEQFVTSLSVFLGVVHCSVGIAQDVLRILVVS
jgi:hypothetical protein